MDIERFAIMAAKGNNGGEWATHYTEEQKEYWRRFVRELLAAAVAAERERCARSDPDDAILYDYLKRLLEYSEHWPEGDKVTLEPLPRKYIATLVKALEER